MMWLICNGSVIYGMTLKLYLNLTLAVQYWLSGKIQCSGNLV